MKGSVWGYEKLGTDELVAMFLARAIRDEDKFVRLWFSTDSLTVESRRRLKGDDDSIVTVLALARCVARSNIGVSAYYNFLGTADGKEFIAGLKQLDSDRAEVN